MTKRFDDCGSGALSGTFHTSFVIEPALCELKVLFVKVVNKNGIRVC